MLILYRFFPEIAQDMLFFLIAVMVSQVSTYVKTYTL